MTDRDYFHISLTEEKINAISSLGLAHIGDAVYELMVRSMLCTEGGVTARGLHSATVAYVRAPAQAGFAAKIQNVLTAEELAVYRRGRNTHVHSVPRGANVSEYHSATGLEALFGWLYLHGRSDRLNELFSKFFETEGDSDAS